MLSAGFNSEALYTRPGTDEQVSVLNTTGRGYYIVGVLGVGQEPTNHALKDIEVKKAEFEKWGRTIVLLFTDEAAYKKFDRKEFPNLPSNVVFGIDKDGSILKMIAENMKAGQQTHPAGDYPGRYVQPCSLRITRIHHRHGRATAPCYPWTVSASMVRRTFSGVVTG